MIPKGGWLHRGIPDVKGVLLLIRFSIFVHANNIHAWETEAFANQVLILPLKWVQ